MDTVYIVPLGTHDLVAHRTTDMGATTLCGLRYEDWPDLPGTPDGEHDKDWYADHDRDDVTTCGECVTKSDWISPAVGTAARMRDDSRLRHGRLA